MLTPVLDRVVTCGRCEAILTIDELENQRYDDRVRCGGCDCMTGLSRGLSFADVKTPTKESAATEWVRRVRIAETTPDIIRHRVDVRGTWRVDGTRIS